MSNSKEWFVAKDVAVAYGYNQAKNDRKTLQRDERNVNAFNSLHTTSTPNQTYTTSLSDPDRLFSKKLSVSGALLKMLFVRAEYKRFKQQTS